MEIEGRKATGVDHALDTFRSAASGLIDAVEAGDDATARALVEPLHPADVADLIELAARDEREHGLGDLPYPPEHPKMKGEPKRVQPSRAKKQT